MTITAANALNHLRRPSLLIRAARFGLPDYNRKRSLERILRDAPSHAQDAPLSPLIAAEADCEALRTAGDARYDVARHVEVLIAVISEAHLALRTAAKV